MNRCLYVLKLGSALPEVAAEYGDFEQWTTDGMDVKDVPVKTVDVRRGEALPDLERVAGVALTGSESMVTDREEWSERAARWLPGVVRAGIPVLGICYGHQLLAHALGGRVGDNPRGREFGTVEIRLLPGAGDDPLLGCLPAAFLSHQVHKQSVLEPPAGATVLASNDMDSNQAFVVGGSAWGVQFHPEFNAAIMRSYADALRESLVREGMDADAVKEKCRDTWHGAALLKRFGEIVAGKNLEI